MKRTVALIAVAALLVACGKKTEQTVTTSTSTTSLTEAQKNAPSLPPGHPEIKGMMPATQTAANAANPVPTAGMLTGTVAEATEASGYTYVRVKTASGDQWAAVNQTKLTVGQPISIVPSVTMENFESKTLKKKFDKIVFGTIQGATPAAMPMGQPATAAAQGDPRATMMAQHAAAAQGPANVGDVKVAKAEGIEGKTVAEVWAARASLKDSSVAIRGKVVKFLPGIMGRNWLHLRDGSGSQAKGDEDITVTTNESAKVGDVVVVRGLVRVNKDFGAGYSYPVIIEEAKIVK